MRHSVLQYLVLAALLSTGTLIGRSTTPVRLERRVAEQQLNSRVSSYLALRAAIIQQLQGDDAADAIASAPFLQTALQAARHDARQSDLVGETNAAFIREVVQRDMAAWSVADRRAVLDEVPARISLRVNDRYPEGQPLATMPPRLLAKLPFLPSPVEYRFVGDAVILLDADARLVLDVVPNVLEAS